MQKNAHAEAESIRQKFIEYADGLREGCLCQSLDEKENPKKLGRFPSVDIFDATVNEILAKPAEYWVGIGPSGFRDLIISTLGKR